MIAAPADPAPSSRIVIVLVFSRCTSFWPYLAPPHDTHATQSHDAKGSHTSWETFWFGNKPGAALSRVYPFSAIALLIQQSSYVCSCSQVSPSSPPYRTTTPGTRSSRRETETLRQHSSMAVYMSLPGICGSVRAVHSSSVAVNRCRVFAAARYPGRRMCLRVMCSSFVLIAKWPSGPCVGGRRRSHERFAVVSCPSRRSLTSASSSHFRGDSSREPPLSRRLDTYNG